ncbi:POT family domain-containing protein [Ditylenchus destructor]|uniref:POT family domain-containing protein n=1 Tax=Ditylenchus destructor TaxID=166010 RepID=A0AAD4MIL2_9BILA|nr:POT family domain-containing protein [Ditylenchus destructor]
MPDPSESFVSFTNTFDNCSINVTLIKNNIAEKSLFMHPNTSLKTDQHLPPIDISYSQFRKEVQHAYSCLGHDTCYPLSFGVSAGIMVFATVIVMAGKNHYVKQPSEESLCGEICRIIKRSARNKCMSSNQIRTHWLDYYMDTHNCLHDEKCVELKACHKEQLIREIKQIFRVSIMLLPVPVSWHASINSSLPGSFRPSTWTDKSSAAD